MTVSWYKNRRRGNLDVSSSRSNAFPSFNRAPEIANDVAVAILCYCCHHDSSSNRLLSRCWKKTSPETRKMNRRILCFLIKKKINSYLHPNKRERERNVCFARLSLSLFLESLFLYVKMISSEIAIIKSSKLDFWYLIPQSFDFLNRSHHRLTYSWTIFFL